MGDLEKKVIECYTKCLNRNPDTCGLKTYTDFLRQGNDPQELMRILMSSSEYTQLHTQPTIEFYVNTEDIPLRCDFSYAVFKNTTCKSFIAYILSSWHSLPDKLVFTDDVTICHMNKLLHSGEEVYFESKEPAEVLGNTETFKIITDTEYSQKDVKITSFCVSRQLIQMKKIETFEKCMKTLSTPFSFPEYVLPFCWKHIFKSEDYRQVKIVVSRYNENIDWTKDLSNVLIYNKGNPIKSKHIVTELENIGREGETYLNHIIKNYDSLDSYTIFCQGDPFEHSPNFIDMVKTHMSVFKECQPLTYCWKEFDEQCSWFLTTNPTGIPPKEIRDLTKHHWLGNSSRSEIHVERLNRNFECIYPLKWQDGGFNNDLIPRLKHKNNIDTTVLEWVYTKIGLSNENIPMTIPFSFSAIFGVSKRKIHLRPKSFYIKMRNFLLEDSDHGYILERMWLHIFDY